MRQTPIGECPAGRAAGRRLPVRCVHLVCSTATLLLTGQSARAQTPPAPSTTAAHARPRIGLALSGGAARGLAHIGVLKVLEAAGVPIDVVAGTSMGSVVGGLYAVGYTAAELDTIVTTADWLSLLTDPVGRRDLSIDRKLTEDHYLLTLPIYRGGIHLPRGVVAGERLSQLLTRLTWSVHGVRDFHTLPIPFSAVATDLETGTAVTLDHGFLPDVMRASAALPSLFSPVEVEGRVLIDGAVVRNLPAQDARALGAEFLICSDVTDSLEPRDSIISFVDVLVQAVSFRIWDSETAERSRCDVLITPKVRAFPGFAFTRAPELIARGEDAARAALPQIQAALAPAARTRVVRPPRAPPESVRVVTVRFEAPARVTPGFLARTFGLSPPVWTSPDAVDAAIERLYATGLFETVRYRLEPLPNGPPAERALTVVVKERSPGRVSLGLRYDSRYKASILLSSSFGGIAGFDSRVQVNARLGQQIQLDVGAAQPLGEGSPVTVRGGGDYAHSPFDLYSQGRRVAQARVDLGAVSAAIAARLGSAGGVSTVLKAEHARWVDEVSAVDTAPINRTFYSATGVLELDTYNRGLFPNRGVGLLARSEWGERLLGTGGAFSHQFAELRAYLPLYRTISLWGGVTVGASGGDPPPHYRFFLGGANTYYLFPDRMLSFAGLHTQELSGRHVQKAEVGAQWEFFENVFGQLRWNAGNVYERWTWDPAHYIDGLSIALGAKTFAGRLNVSVSGTGRTTWPIVELDLGYPF
ncbi:MAG TPA: patatin-like phospholipase family protein [Gemmatimonadales bacterium]|nr:patatin-like phospholipase family protein [Gemmatimonadales bacterium]